MTEDEINAAVAECCGLQTCGDCDPCIGGRPDQCAISRPPNYCGDRNAMANALATLTPEGRVRFVHELGLEVLKLCPLAGEYWMAQELDCWVMINASPKELAIAFLRAHSKWP